MRPTCYSILYSCFLFVSSIFGTTPVASNMKNKILRQYPFLKGKEFEIYYSEAWKKFDIVGINIKSGPEPCPNIILIKDNKKTFIILDWQSTLFDAVPKKSELKFETYIIEQSTKFILYASERDQSLQLEDILEGIAKYVCINAKIINNVEDAKEYLWNHDVIGKVEQIITLKNYKKNIVLINSYKYGIIEFAFKQTGRTIEIIGIRRICTVGL